MVVHDSYVSRKPQLLRSFDRSVARLKPMLAARYGEVESRILVREARQEYEELIPHIPYIGDRTPMLIFLLPTTRYLAIYLALQRHGGSVEEAGQLIYAMCEADCEAIPALARRVAQELWFSRWFRRRIERRAARSHRREHPGGYVLTYVEGDGIEFDYGVDYVECACCKMLETQGAEELGPYVCAVDQVAGELFGWGLRRTTTLVEGGERCDFRFKKGGRTEVAVPSALGLPGGEPQSGRKRNLETQGGV
jgi:hypothetical protein